MLNLIISASGGGAGGIRQLPVDTGRVPLNQQNPGLAEDRLPRSVTQASPEIQALCSQERHGTVIATAGQGFHPPRPHSSNTLVPCDKDGKPPKPPICWIS